MHTTRLLELEERVYRTNVRGLEEQVAILSEVLHTSDEEDRVILRRHFYNLIAAYKHRSPTRTAHVSALFL